MSKHQWDRILVIVLIADLVGLSFEVGQESFAYIWIAFFVLNVLVTIKDWSKFK